MTAASTPSLLFYADTHASRDLLYFGRFECHDPFIALRHQGKKIAVLNALEFGRGLKESAFDEILPLEPLQAEARKARPEVRPGPADIIALLAAKLRIRTLVVPDEFPAGLLERLRERCLDVTVARDAVLPEREIKDAREAAAIRAGNRVAAAGFAAAEALLRNAKIVGKKLVLDGKPLTSERVRLAIEIACLEAGGLALDTIVAGGDQACDPHERGSGPLRAHQAIILDIFPRDPRTGYFGDITRTLVKGRPSDALHHLHTTVAQSQKRILRHLRAGLNGEKAQDELRLWFRNRGYPTEIRRGRWTGFFHGVGHGLGLEIHEAPRFAVPKLPAGAVITVEPGLYVPGTGGVRIEDVVHLSGNGHRRLTRFPNLWQI